MQLPVDGGVEYVGVTCIPFSPLIPTILDVSPQRRFRVMRLFPNENG
jgi:hypothetical protein